MFEGAALVYSSCISGLNRCHRAVHPPDEAPAGLSLVQPAGAIDAHYEHSGVCFTKLLGSFFFLLRENPFPFPCIAEKFLREKLRSL